MESLNITAAIILGIIEGLTEFLPVSSTGHLILTSKFLSYSGKALDSFEIFIQLGAILAVVLLYYKRFFSLLDFKNPTKKGFSGFIGLSKLAVATFPALLMGYLFGDFIQEKLFKASYVAIALIVGGLIMIFIEKKKSTITTNSIEEISYKQCLGIGLIQCFALWPGMSRSASTIIGGILLGLPRTVAAEFSFLVAVPVISAASLYSLLKSYSELNSSDITIFAIGLIVAFITAVLSMKVFIHILKNFTLTPFAIYRIILGLIVLLS
jgi:undecaprenyl-diphosphatase